MLCVAGASTALSLGAGAVTATGDDGSAGDGSDSDGSDGSAEPPNPDDIDPIFGYPSAAENPCLGEASDDCFEAFAPSVRPTREVGMCIDTPELLFAVGGRGVLSEETTRNVNAAEALESDALHPERIASRGTVSWREVVEAYRTE